MLSWILSGYLAGQLGCFKFLVKRKTIFGFLQRICHRHNGINEAHASGPLTCIQTLSGDRESATCRSWSRVTLPLWPRAKAAWWAASTISLLACAPPSAHAAVLDTILGLAVAGVRCVYWTASEEEVPQGLARPEKGQMGQVRDGAKSSVNRQSENEFSSTRL